MLSKLTSLDRWLFGILLILTIVLLYHIQHSQREGFVEGDQLAPDDNSKTGPWRKHPQVEPTLPFKPTARSETVQITTEKEPSSLVWWIINTLQLLALYLVKLPYEILRIVIVVPFTYFTDLLKSFAPLVDTLVDLYRQVRKAISDGMLELIKMYRSLMNLVKNLPKIIQNILRQVLKIVGDIFKAIFSALKGLIMFLVSIPKMLFNAFRSFIQAFKLEFFLTLFTKFFQMLFKLPILSMQLMIKFTDKLDQSVSSASAWTGAWSFLHIMQIVS